MIIEFSRAGRITLHAGKEPPSPDRALKGRSLIETRKDFTAIDIETTGLSYAYDTIIDLGAVRFRDGKPAARFDQLVNPGYEIDDYISKLTGITNDMLRNAPSLSEVLPIFLDFVGEDVLLGHNVHFDINFIYDSCVDLGLEPLKNDFIDTLRVARNLYKDIGSHTLDHMMLYLGVPPRELHRGVDDAALAAELYLRMIADRPGTINGNGIVRVRSRKNSKDLQPSGPVDPNSSLLGKAIVFTGALSIEREDAIQIAVNAGAVVRSSVSRKTDFLVVGIQDLSVVGDDGMSGKEEKAYALNRSGQAHIEIISEDQFLVLAGAKEGSKE